MKSNFLESIQKSQEQRHEIEQKTILQSSSGEWLELRRTMLTASNFGKICKMRPETSCANTVKQLLYKGSVQAEPLQHGKEHEQMALAQLSKQEGIDIKPCGFFIDSEVPYLGATPDGISGEDVVVEVKCPITAYRIGLEEAIKEKKVNFWVTDKDGNLGINLSHNWYYQIQGQLHVTK
ncbi:unnamed protein product [Plutella xylostella]|uniref:(diamondback moth) hypothetical protein n=1 Tax=Plutella xylostella TaxID=51655 RepID=A0A8S4GGQ5_PLUXY|nr:unnamed protein product [Plutella xylostella]